MRIKIINFIIFALRTHFSIYFAYIYFHIKEFAKIYGQYCSIRTLVNEKTYLCGNSAGDSYVTMFNWGTLSPPSNN